MKKFSIVSGIASILGLCVAFLPTDANSLNQAINGNKNTVIGTNEGNVTINYNESDSSSGEQYVIVHPSGGGTYLLSDPSIASYGDSSKFICALDQGTKVLPTGPVHKEHNLVMAKFVKVQNGSCSGRHGWVTTATLAMK